MVIDIHLMELYQKNKIICFHKYINERVMCKSIAIKEVS